MSVCCSRLNSLLIFFPASTSTTGKALCPGGEQSFLHTDASLLVLYIIELGFILKELKSGLSV